MRDLSMQEAVIPRHPGLFSAAGLLATDLRVDESATVLRIIDNASMGEIAGWFHTTGEALRVRLRKDGIDQDRIRLQPAIDCRYKGQGFELSVPVDSTALDPDRVRRDFRDIHHALYGHTSEEPVEAVTLRMSAFGTLAVGSESSGGESSHLPRPVSARMLKLREMPVPVQVAVYARDDLGAGARLAGPCIVEQPDATTVVLASQAARVDGFGNLCIKEVPHG